MHNPFTFDLSACQSDQLCTVLKSAIKDGEVEALTAPHHDDKEYIINRNKFFSEFLEALSKHTN